MGETDKLHTPEEWAAYLVRSLRDQDVDDEYYGKIIADFSRDRTMGERQMLAVHLLNNESAPHHEYIEESYWDQITDELAAYLASDFFLSPVSDEELPVPVTEPTIDVRYAPAGPALSKRMRPDPYKDIWLTKIITAYDPENRAAYTMTVDYMEEDAARDEVQWLLDAGQQDQVEALIEKSQRYGYGEQEEGFTEELVKYGGLQAEALADEAYSSEDVRTDREDDDRSGDESSPV